MILLFFRFHFERRAMNEEDSAASTDDASAEEFRYVLQVLLMAMFIIN